jgi:hypothetical protein
MRVLIDVNHPAHVHVFRNAARQWLDNEADDALFTATQKDVALQLLAAYKLPHQVIYVRQPGKLNLAKELVLRTFKLLRVARRFQPDVFLSVGSPTAAFAAWLLRKPHISFEDTEDSIGQIWLYRPFTRWICVPDCFLRDLGEKMVSYPGCHELTYLHPKRFIPDPTKITPLSSRERYFVVRFIKWDAAHDTHARGFSQECRRELLDLLQAQGKVVLSEESQPPVLLPDNIPLPAEAMHHLLAFAQMYIGEGVTAASEAALLGTPSILVNSREVGYIKEQEERYRLTYRFDDEHAALEKIMKLLRQPDLKNVWDCRREVLLRDKIDVTAWMDQFVRENV